MHWLGIVAAEIEPSRGWGVCVEGFWLHPDADVLDDAVMPAVESRRSGGTSNEGVADLVGSLLRSGLAVGAEVTVFDTDGRIVAAFATAIVAILRDGGSVDAP